MDAMHAVWGLVIGGAAVALVVAVTRRTWDKVELPYLPPPNVLELRRAGAARHPRVELEFHAHRHWGVHRSTFKHGELAGWSLHLGFGAGCLCVDFYRHGRRP